MRKEYFPETLHTTRLRDISKKRLAIPGLIQATLGALAYLNDTHVHDSTGYYSSSPDFLIEKNKALMGIGRAGSAVRSFLGRYLIKESHMQGSWPGFVHFLPELTNSLVQPFYVATDYNLFTTVSTAYSLFFIDDSRLPDDLRFVETILGNAWNAIRKFRRGEAYNFWPSRTDPRKGYPASGPMNIPLPILDLRRRIYERTGLLSMKGFHEAELLMDWIDACYDKRLNPSGSAALFNIPDDADNTSMAVGFQLLYYKRFEQPQALPDTGPLELPGQFRDLHRTKSDRKNTGLGKETGAFLTWLKDEQQPSFSGAEQGIIPLWANNVDIVINANVLFALSLAGMQQTAGYDEAMQLMVKCIDEYSWPVLSLYYPEKYVFPYAVSRAWRDGGVRDPLIDRVMPKLMLQLLDEQSRFEKKNPGMAGAFPGDKFDNCLLSTALGLNTLLNLGRPVAEKCDSYKQLVLAADKAVQFLVRHRRAVQARQNITRRQFRAVPPNFWESGVLFTSSLQPLAHWRSHAQTTSLVLEAFSKYIIAYELEESPFLSRRLGLSGNHRQICELSVLDD